MPVLRRPHDYHRDLRARLRAKVPHHTSYGSDQDRHLMMLSPSIRDRSDARLSCWLLVGSAQVRVGPPQRLAITPAILARNVHPARSRVPAPRLRGKAIRASSSDQPSAALRRSQIPIAPAAPPVPHPPRFRALALFGRRPHQRVEEPVIAGVRKPAQKRTFALQQNPAYWITSSASNWIE